MKLNSKFYLTFDDVKNQNPAYISLIPIVKFNPVKIYPISYQERLTIVCETIVENFFITQDKIKIVNTEVNFTKCEDVRVKLLEVFNIQDSSFECNISNIKYISCIINEDDELGLCVAFNNGDKVFCKSIENIGG